MGKEFVSRTKDQFGWGIFLACVTLGLSFFIAYEAFFERLYWINTWKLHNYLKKGKVKFVSYREVFKDDHTIDVDEVVIDINGNEYVIWIYVKEKSFTLASTDYSSRHYLGLFSGSVITKILRKRIYKRVTRLIPSSTWQ